MPYRSIPLPSCKDAAVQVRLARLFLTQINSIDRATFQRRLKVIRASGPIQAPLALHWLLSALGRFAKPGEQRQFFLEQADIAMEDAVVLRKLRRGWSQFGVSDPWLAVFPERTPWQSVIHIDVILAAVHVEG